MRIEVVRSLEITRRGREYRSINDPKAPKSGEKYSHALDMG
jgi:hypothetical protein